MSEAAAARDAGHLEKALALYAKALKLQPSFVEGHWHIGTISFELERYEQARNAFQMLIGKDPENGAAWAFKGLSAFRLGDYDAALTDLLRGQSLGVAGDGELGSFARYHTALLWVRSGQHERALRLLAEFAAEANDSPSVVEAMGLATLRIAKLPAELPEERRSAVMLAGRAMYFASAGLGSAAREAFEQLLDEEPGTPHARYAYGLFLAETHPDAAIDQFERELEVSQQHPSAQTQLALAHFRRGRWTVARRWAERAVDEAPACVEARMALAEILLQAGLLDEAIRQLEAGAKLAPTSASLQRGLARAYRQAGRAEQAERHESEARRLEPPLASEPGRRERQLHPPRPVQLQPPEGGRP